MRGQVSAAAVRRLRRGVELEDGMTDPAKVEAMDRKAPGRHVAADRAHRGAQPADPADGGGGRPPRDAAAPLPLRRHRPRAPRPRAMAPAHAGRSGAASARSRGWSAEPAGRQRGARARPRLHEDTQRSDPREHRRAARARSSSATSSPPDDLISIIFTATADLRRVPRRRRPRDRPRPVPLLCASEIPVPGRLGMCIRVMVHCYAPPERPIRHVYLHDARQLRPDLAHRPSRAAQSMSRPRSRAGAEWVRAPTEPRPRPSRRPRARPRGSSRPRPRAARAPADERRRPRAARRASCCRAGSSRRRRRGRARTPSRSSASTSTSDAGQLAAGPRDRVGQAGAREREVVVLHQHPVEEAHPVVRAAAGDDRGLLQRPHPRRRLAGVEHRGGGGGLGVGGGQGRDP